MSRKVKIQIIAGVLIANFLYTAIIMLTGFADLYPLLNRLVVAPLSEAAPAILAIKLLSALLLVFRSSRLAGFYISFFLLLFLIGYPALILVIPDKITVNIQELAWQPRMILNTLTLVTAAAGIHLQLNEATGQKLMFNISFQVKPKTCRKE